MRNHPVASRGGVHQTVAAPIHFKTGWKSIQIGFTDQRLSPYAGSATFWGWLASTRWRHTLEAALPHPRPTSNNAVAFFLDLWEQLPRHIRLRGVRADAGFCLPELLALWERLELSYVVVRS